MSDVLMVVAQDGYRDEEYDQPRSILEAAGHRILVASRRPGPIHGRFGGTSTADIALADVGAAVFSAVIFVGGGGAAEYFDDPDAHEVAQEADRRGSVVGAICIAPSILARAGLLSGRRCTCFASSIDDLRAGGGIPVEEHVVVDGNFITADGPDSAAEFGRCIVAALGESTVNVEGPR